MKLQTALCETALREAEVVAGGAHLEREITWVHMVDHPDISGWIKPGELLLTTGYNWPQSGDGSRELVKKLKEIGLTGVVLAVPHFREHFPREAIEQADAVGLPLLELPWHVQFSEVTHQILANIINFQADMIERSERLHRALTNAAVSATSLNDIAFSLSDLLGRVVTFSDAVGNILASSADADEFNVIEQELIAAVRDDEKTYWLVDIQRPTTISFHGSSCTRRLCFPVRLQETIVALIWLDLNPQSTVELDSRAIEHASVVAALHLMHQRQLSQQEERLGYALVAGLLHKEFHATPNALERARVLGWSESKSYRVCLVLLDEPIPLTEAGLARRERWTESLRRELRARGISELVATWLNQVKFIVPSEVRLDLLWDAISDRSAAMAVSRVHCGVKGMATGSEDVEALVPTLRPGKIHHFGEILFPRALLGDPNAQDMLLDRLIKPLTEKRGGDALLETLGSLTDEGFQLANTSKTMGIHISTLRYRLVRLENVLSVSLEDPQVKFQLQVAMTLYRLREEH